MPPPITATSNTEFATASRKVARRSSMGLSRVPRREWRRGCLSAPGQAEQCTRRKNEMQSAGVRLESEQGAAACVDLEQARARDLPEGHFGKINFPTAAGPPACGRAGGARAPP